MYNAHIICYPDKVVASALLFCIYLLIILKIYQKLISFYYKIPLAEKSSRVKDRKTERMSVNKQRARRKRDSSSMRIYRVVTISKTL